MQGIKIINTPPGFAPLFIREAWVGIVIPFPTEEELQQDGPSGIRIGNQNTGGYTVRTEDAIQALMDNSKDTAAKFWNGFGFGDYLEFKSECCEVVEITEVS